MDKEFKNKHPGRKMESGSVRVIPVFRQPLDIDKLGNAFLSLAIKLNEKKSALKKKPDSGGQRHD